MCVMLTAYETTLEMIWPWPFARGLKYYLVGGGAMGDRIYEVHVHLKHSVICAFLAYFETVYFTKAIQLLNLKDDEYFHFLT